MTIEIAGFVLSILTFVALVVYAYFTYLIAKDSYTPFVSFSLNQIKFSHVGFSMINRSKIEVEVFSKLWTKIDNNIFQFKKGFYANDTNWILQPFTTGGGHFNLKDLINGKEEKLNSFITNNSKNSINFNLQIKYRKVGSRKWKKSSPQNFIYNFETKAFWLNV